VYFRQVISDRVGEKDNKVGRVRPFVSNLSLKLTFVFDFCTRIGHDQITVD